MRLMILITMFLSSLLSFGSTGSLVFHESDYSYTTFTYNSKKDKCEKEEGYGNNFPRTKRVSKKSEVCQLLKKASKQVKKSGKCEPRVIKNEDLGDSRIDMRKKLEITSSCKCLELFESSYSYHGEYSSEVNVYIRPMSICKADQ